MSTIYRKYRPQIFSDVTGQEHIIKTITNEVATSKIAHAYLFCGPRGTGKTTLARLLAKAVNCQNKKDGEYEPCNTCSSCQELMGGHSIDIIEVDAASHTGVDNVRENIIENAQFKPTKSKYKVFIIDEVHMLSTSAFNALLKTLEEPPAHAIFILATTESHKLPATIISRCQRFNFKKVGYTDMTKRLEAICKNEAVTVDTKVLDRIINKSDGCVRDAESLLGQILSLDLKNISSEDAELILPTSHIGSILEFINLTVDKEPGKAIELIQKLITDGVNLEQFAYDSIEALRLAMIIHAGSQTKNFNTDYGQEDLKLLKIISEKITSNQIIRLLESLIARHREIKSAPLPQLPLELFAVEFGTGLEHAANTQSPQTTPAPVKPTEPVHQPSPTPEITNQTIVPNDAPNTPTPPEEKPINHPITEAIKETISHITHKETKTTLEEVKAKWGEITAIVAKSNHSLSFILKMSELVAVNNGHLHITVPYSFHKDKLSEIKTRKTIEQAIADIFSENIGLICDVAENNNQQNNEEDSELNKLAADFGGEVL
ncbi:MAG: DNA polymerase III subunit gamma/tau [Candidatus Magasanikbacteria bacterium]|nr:DNA polymerase III subunit gamma/tau [Candidatus Magasanikbacteria bacterium]